MTDVRVSVIMAVYNASEFLDEAIGSVLGQTFPFFELILINDYSTDNSAEIIRKYSNEDNRIVFLDNAQNLGRALTRNIGLDKARGKYIAILDADDIAMPERLDNQVRFLDTNPDVFLVGSGAIRIDEKGNKIGVHTPIIDKDSVEERLKQRNCIYHSSVMFRRTETRYREKFPYSQDYDYYLQLLAAGKKLTNIPDHLIQYRISSGAASWTNAVKQKLFAQKAKDFYNESLIGLNNGYDEFYPESILNLDLTNSNDKLVLETEIEALFKLSEFRKMRKICRKYFSLFGILNNFCVMYLLSFGGKRIVDLVRKNLKKVH
ncbi:MAG: glycosyltransferase family 2 protein [Flavobacteriales bacterium]